ncbi:Formate dehydrogenase H [Planctomycetes bacterium Pla86]|nr:Formate dehydrogenase H [Planctomycetes bacterium Pla133]QDU99509.1 Formate dehydrogenase H [Planctomycetes bacterium Pla86]
MSNPLVDMEKPDVIFCIGTNMTETHPVAATRLKTAIRNGATLICADPRKIPLARMADLHLPLRVGSDVALLGAMAHVIVRDGLTDEAFIAERTEGYDALVKHLETMTPEWAEGICGVPAADIERAAHLYAGAERGAIYYTLGITEHICGVDNVQSLSNLVLLTGNIGREGTGINPMRGQNNIQGAGDAGALPNNYPGFQPVTNPANQAKFAQAWGREVDLELGITKVRALEQCGESIFAMLICGENTVVSDPDRAHCEHALDALEHLVVIDMFLTETAERADVVFPAAGWGEVDGVFTNTERRVQRVRKAVEPPGSAKPDWEIIAGIARAMGLGDGFPYQSAKDVFNELCQLSTTYAGLDWDRIDKGEYHWPVPDREHPGTPILHLGEFPRGRGLFVTPGYRDPAETVSDDYPIWLTTGRRLAHYHTRTMTGRAKGPDWLVPEELLEVHPDDVQRLSLVDGGVALMKSPRGEVLIKVKATDQSPRGTVFCSFSFGDVRVNDLTGAGYDPITDTAELKVCPVSVEPAGARV